MSSEQTASPTFTTLTADELEQLAGLLDHTNPEEPDPHKALRTKVMQMLEKVAPERFINELPF